MLSARALSDWSRRPAAALPQTLKVGARSWYEGGGFVYHATMPTDAFKALQRHHVGNAGLWFQSFRKKPNGNWAQKSDTLSKNGIQSVAARAFGVRPASS